MAKTSLSPQDRRQTLHLIVLGVVALVLFLGLTPFSTRGEPREAVVAMSMLQQDNWVLPVNNGDEIPFKPPFLHWLVAAFSSVAGGISVLTSRLPSALGTLCLVVATYLFFARRRDSHTAFAAALILLTNFEVHRSAVTCRVDMLLAVCMVCGLYALVAWGERRLKGVPWLAVACLAGAALTKGPVGVALPCAIGGLWFLLRGQASLWTALWKMTLVFVAALLPLGLWYVAAWTQPHGGDRFLQLIYEENVLRFTGQMTYASHINPWPYNIQTIVAGMAPYTLLWLLAIPTALAGIKSWRPNWQLLWPPVLLQRFRTMHATEAFSLLAATVVFVFYCIPASKRSVYLLPMYPFLAWFTARLMLWLERRRSYALPSLAYLLAFVTMAVSAAFVAIQCGWVTGSMFGGKHAAENAAYVQALADVPLSVLNIVLFVLPLALLWPLRRRHGARRPLTSIFIVYGLFVAFEGLYRPAVMTVHSDRAVANTIARMTGHAPIYSFRTDVCEANRMHPFTINFYLNNRITPIDKVQQPAAKAYLLCGDDDVEAFKKDYPQWDVQMKYDSHHRSCDDRKVQRLYLITQKKRP